MITLTIIGVIAAMTVPTLLMNHQKQTYVVGLKKAYSVLTNAFQMMPMVANCSHGDYDCIGLGEGVYDSRTGTYTKGVTDIDGQSFGDGNFGHKIMYLLSKTIKAKEFHMGSLDTANNEFHKYIYNITGCYTPAYIVSEDGIIYGMHWARDTDITIDVNGLKGPNKPGRDIFSIEIAKETKNGIQEGTLLPNGSNAYAQYTNTTNNYWKNSNNCTTANVAQTDWTTRQCTGRVLEEDKMNY